VQDQAKPALSVGVVVILPKEGF